MQWLPSLHGIFSETNQSGLAAFTSYALAFPSSFLALVDTYDPTCTPTNENLMELLVMIDACWRASAKTITAVIPYFGYAMANRKANDAWLIGNFFSQDYLVRPDRDIGFLAFALLLLEQDVQALKEMCPHGEKLKTVLGYLEKLVLGILGTKPVATVEMKVNEEVERALAKLGPPGLDGRANSGALVLIKVYLAAYFTTNSGSRLTMWQGGKLSTSLLTGYLVMMIVQLMAKGWEEKQLIGFKRLMHLSLLDISSNSHTQNARNDISRGDGSPNWNDRKRMRHLYQSKTFKVENSFAGRIPVQAISSALRGQESKNSQEALRVLDIILRQHATKK
ncbi:Ribose-phosphate pyrophosphokinase, N-terminal domain [Dillenia turbinata]|uniref:Ribose-phosphate pyrophosphokinase, N-terminal domain n=1 Tax=Dillenia turbinata TaxID=194707 RepID=A0AAN8VS95_9MAGN